VVLRDVDVEVPRGGRAVVLGPSGSGKSTMLRVLKGDLLPQSGEVLVDGVRLGAATRDRVRASSALVAQSTWLFTGSVRDNLALVRPQASEQELWAALELVDLADFVRGMPQGIDSAVGERGQALSGGQAQRISLARAFLSGRQLLLLDEPTSQVDLFSEQVIMAALDRLAADHTIVLVTHRMSAAGGASALWSVSAQTVRPTEVRNV
ncbi:MAG: ATP-binding cassette domain-containing protein, partial [Propionibacterium sp.]